MGVQAETKPAKRVVYVGSRAGTVTLSRSVNSQYIKVDSPGGAAVNVDDLKEGIEEVMKDE